MTNPEPLILCGTDFSESARGAADTAAALARALRAGLQLVHVSADAEDASALRALQREVERVRAASGVDIRGVLPTGDAASVLTSMATATGARLIVVGAQGAGGSILQLGGTAEQIVQGARTAVLAVRNGADIVAWLNDGPLVIGAIVTEDAASARALEWVRALRAVRPCDVHVLHGYYMDQATHRYGTSLRPLTEPDPEIEGYLRRDLASAMADRVGEGSCTFHPVLALGRMSDHLVERATECGAHLLVVGNHRARGLARLSSVASGVLHFAPMSVLLVPVDAPAVARAPLPLIRRVLVATDFSRFGNEAVRHAYGLVPENGAVMLLHVMTGAPDELARYEACERLRALIPLEAASSIATEVEALWNGNVAATIVAIASRTGADGIVIASHGHTGLRRAVLGSVAESVARSSRAPVHIVRPASDT